jgi:NADPH:quinone reductase-like Zn-dependent oxidoreductase
MAADQFDLLTRGVLSVEPGKAYPLAQADAAHAELESRQAPGPLLLIP